MDLIEAIKLWEELGGTFVSWDKGEGKPYITLFVWNEEVEGNCTAHPGSGFSWDWPQRLLDAKKAQQECVFDQEPEYDYEG